MYGLLRYARSDKEVISLRGNVAISLYVWECFAMLVATRKLLGQIFFQLNAVFHNFACVGKVFYRF